MIFMIGILIILFIGYCIGWLVSLIVFLAGSAKSWFHLAIAHAYAILLLLLTAEIIKSDIAEVLHVLCLLDFLAIVVFLELYVRAEQKRVELPLTQTKHIFINSDEA